MADIFKRSPIDTFAEGLSEQERKRIALDYDQLSRTGRVSEDSLLRIKTEELKDWSGQSGSADILWMSQLGDAVHRVTSYAIMEAEMEVAREPVEEIEP